MAESTYTVKPFPPIRQATIDLLSASGGKHMIHGLIEVDVSLPRRLLRAMKEATGEAFSFTGYIIYCCAQAVDRNRHMQAYRDWRNRLIIFDDVDVSTPVERIVDGRHLVVPTIIRSANHKSVAEIHEDIRAAQAETAEKAGVFRLMQLYLAIPAFVRRFFFGIVGKLPQQLKANAGTIMVTSVGMFGSGAGWGLPIATHTLNVAIGSIVHRPVLVDGTLENREHLCLTVSFDHDIIDGAPAARFIQRFKELVASGSGLPSS
jgi:pyruvate/2-oxoglutarate dehydrogenase complex dihydrolipoamide acyltransferase (E2) component